MNTNENIREDFLLELMMFSPLYNKLIAQAIAEGLPEEKIKELHEKISRINKEEGRKMLQLAESDPDLYDQKVKDKEEEEERIEGVLAKEYDNGSSLTKEQIDKLIHELQESIASYTISDPEQVADRYEGSHTYITNLMDSMKSDNSSDKPDANSTDEQGVPELSVEDKSAQSSENSSDTSSKRQQS